MTATLTVDALPDEPVTIASEADGDRHDPDRSVTRRRVLSAEWFKFRTVRSNLTALFGALGAAIGLGMIFSTLTEFDGPAFGSTDSLSLSLAGFDLAQMIIAILGVTLVAGEYQTGLIRSWFAAVPNRLRVLWAKVGVFGGVVFSGSLIAAVVAFLASQGLADPAAAMSVFDDGVLQAILTTAFYTACIGVMGVGLGFLTRSTAAGASIVVGLLMLAPALTRLLPDSIGDPLYKVLPSSAADAMAGTGDATVELLSAGWGFAVLVGWVVTIVGGAAVSLRRRDA
jgi:ABC-type transport system involved in multi-copper enzyme maturation permease subunit